MHKLSKYCLYVGIVAVGVLFGSADASAITAATGSGTSLTTSPVSTDITIKPGHTASTTLQVMNNESRPQTISVQLEEFKADGVNGEAAIYKPSPGDVSQHWVHFSESTFTAQPKVWHNVDMTISLPPSAALGYYYAVLFTPVTANVQPHAVKGSNAILVLVNTNSGNEIKHLQIKSFTSLKTVYQFLPVTLNVLIHNAGNVHLIPRGDVFISRTPAGKPIDTLSLNGGQGNVLPNSSRQFQVDWDNGFPVYAHKIVQGKVVTDSRGRPLLQLQWNTSKPLSSIRFGRYYAHLVLVYNNGLTDIPVNGYVSFWVVPWQYLLVCLLIICLTAGLSATVLWRGRKNRTQPD